MAMNPAPATTEGGIGLEVGVPGEKEGQIVIATVTATVDGTDHQDPGSANSNSNPKPLNPKMNNHNNQSSGA